MTVFDISQTDPDDPTDDPSTIARPLAGTDDFGIIGTLSDHLTAEGWTISRRHLPSGLNGYTDPTQHSVVLQETLSPAHAAKTLIHETAHIVLEHVSDLENYAQHRGLAETEAESVAYIVAGIAGIDTASYSIGYIASWASSDATLIASTARRVLHAADTLATLLAPTHAHN